VTTTLSALLRQAKNNKKNISKTIRRLKYKK